MSSLPISSESGPTSTIRQYDLDALRGSAMLLGILYHTLLAFTGSWWIVEDPHPHPVYAWLCDAIHGFRMPLFFLISGYFCQMIAARRGIRSLLFNRFQRLILPLALALVTILPATNWARDWAAKRMVDQDIRLQGDRQPGLELTDAARKNDVGKIKHLLESGSETETPEPSSGVRPLGWASLYGNMEAVQLLVDHGADVNNGDSRGNCPLHAAAFLGHDAIVATLLSSGANPRQASSDGNLPADVSRTDWGTTQAIAAILDVPIPRKNDLMQGRVRCRRILAQEMGEPTPADEDPISNANQGVSLDRLREQYRDLLNSPRLFVPGSFLSPFGNDQEQVQLITTPFFNHLWFLWHLWWLTLVHALVLLLAKLFPSVRLGDVPQFGWTGQMAWILLALIPQMFMGVLWPIYGPDILIGLLPAPHLLVYYGVFFAFGARSFGSRHPRPLTYRWWLYLPVALFILLPLGILMRGLPLYGGIIQVLYAWFMSWGLLGLFRQTIQRKQFWITYLADASYFLYLAHFPLVLIGLSWVRPWPIPSLVKILLVCSLSTTYLLFIYQCLVRNTWLGLLLNGRRGASAR